MDDLLEFGNDITFSSEPIFRFLKHKKNCNNSQNIFNISIIRENFAALKNRSDIL